MARATEKRDARREKKHAKDMLKGEPEDQGTEDQGSEDQGSEDQGSEESPEEPETQEEP